MFLCWPGAVLCGWQCLVISRTQRYRNLHTLITTLQTLIAPLHTFIALITTLQGPLWQHTLWQYAPCTVVCQHGRTQLPCAPTLC